MSIAAFYKSTDTTLMSALLAHQAEATRICKLAADFAKKFDPDAEGICLTGLDTYRVARVIRFPVNHANRNSRLWSRPNPKLNYGQFPKKSVARATPEEKAEIARLQKLWESFPEDKADYAPVLAAMGTSYGEFFFNSIRLFVYNDTVYVSTGVKLASHMVEILGSEFESASKAHDAERDEKRKLKEASEREAT